MNGPSEQHTEKMLAERIGRACLQRGWNWGELAQQAGISRTTLYQLLRGAVKRPRMTTLKRIADALQQPVEWLTRSPGSVFPGMERPAAPAPGRHFDRLTNPLVLQACEEHPSLFDGWSPTEWDELYSTFGVGGELTPEGVVQNAVLINERREVLQKLSIVLETHLKEVAVKLVDSLFELVQPEAVDFARIPSAGSPQETAPAPFSPEKTEADETGF